MGISGDARDVLREVAVGGPNFPCGHLEPVNEPWAPVVTLLLSNWQHLKTLYLQCAPGSGCQRGPGNGV